MARVRYSSPALIQLIKVSFLSNSTAFVLRVAGDPTWLAPTRPAGGGGGPGGRRLGAAGRRELEDRGGAAEGIVVRGHEPPRCPERGRREGRRRRFRGWHGEGDGGVFVGWEGRRVIRAHTGRRLACRAGVIIFYIRSAQISVAWGLIPPTDEPRHSHEGFIITST